MQVMPGLRWKIWTQSDPAIAELASREEQLAPLPEIGRLAPDALAIELTKAQAGLSFVKPCLSKLASSATKVAEYLAAGLPVVATASVGDTDEHLAPSGSDQKPVGVLIREFTPDAYRTAAAELQQLLEDPLLPSRCRAVAEQYYDLERIGWKRYIDLYRLILA